ncbi:MAG: M23 family metallopeptidase [Candidatus Paceibacterota bacterium]|jgi:murein DD-endopeptidase MepM/ murein hydrolase activator NlpD
MKALIALLLLFACMGNIAARDNILKLKQGESMCILLDDSIATHYFLDASLSGISLPIIRYHNHFYVLLVADFQKKTGKYSLVVRNGRDTLLREAVIVEKHIFERKILGIPYEFNGVFPTSTDSVNKASLLQTIAIHFFSQLWQGGFSQPFEDMRIISPFGKERIYTNTVSYHSGVDLAADSGSVVHAIGDGVVRWAKPTALYAEGLTVAIDHGGGILSLYLHLSRICVKEGTLVARGQVIGEVGSTGHSSGPHLHLMIKVGKARVDPMQFMRVLTP